MKNNILLKTNLLVSVILLVGFALIATLSYRANYNASLVKIKQVSSLASEGIYYRLSTMLTKPVNISQTMAHDSLLIKLLEEEGSRPASPIHKAKSERSCRTGGTGKFPLQR